MVLISKTTKFIKKTELFLLLYKGFLDHTGKPIFKPEPMTFNDPATKSIFPVWDEYFKNLKKPVPEGQPGLNSGSMSRSDKIEIVYRFY